MKPAIHDHGSREAPSGWDEYWQGDCWRNTKCMNRIPQQRASPRYEYVSGHRQGAPTSDCSTLRINHDRCIASTKSLARSRQARDERVDAVWVVLHQPHIKPRAEDFALTLNEYDRGVIGIACSLCDGLKHVRVERIAPLGCCQSDSC